MMCCRLDRTTMRRAAAVSCVCGALAATAGCAMMGHMRPAADSYTYDVGLASGPEIRTKAADIFKGLGYRVVWDDPSKPVYMETQWQSREPADDEERSRGHEIISRIKLTGAPREAAGESTVFHVLVTIENRFVPTQATRRDARGAASSDGYAQRIVKGMAVVFGGSAGGGVTQPRPF
jgi:hypothetical protein